MPSGVLFRTAFGFENLQPLGLRFEIASALGHSMLPGISLLKLLHGKDFDGAHMATRRALVSHPLVMGLEQLPSVFGTGLRLFPPPRSLRQRRQSPIDGHLP
jgi:hypothetical protein